MKTGLFSKTFLSVMAASLFFSAFAMMGHKQLNISLAKKDRPGNAAEGIAVMELFTSQGCSSCPPADALLAAYAASGDPHIIPLSFHVDYWNRLGWADPFSSNLYSARQQWYSKYLPGGSVYTPQLVVNGNTETVGNNREAVGKLVQKALKTAVSGHITADNLVVENNSLHFHYTVSGIHDSEMLNIALIEKAATTQIRAGENKGVTITNRNIVRSFKTVSLVSEKQEIIALPPGFQKEGYALVLYTQDRQKGLITTAILQSL